MDKCLDGVFDAAQAMAALARCDPREFGWTKNRLQEMKRLRIPDAEAIRFVKNEARYRPWEK